MIKLRFIGLLALLIIACGCSVSEDNSTGQNISLSFSDAIADEEYAGRVLIVFSTDTTRDPISRMGWFNHPFTIAQDIAVSSTSDRQTIDPTVINYPVPLDSLSAGTYSVQALFDVNKDRRSVANAPGNMYSSPQMIQFHPDSALQLSLELEKVFEERVFEETEFVKEIEVESKLLSDFYGYKVTMKAGVVLPDSYYESDATYPAVYIIPGFGGRHYGAARYADRYEPYSNVDKVLIVLDPDCHTGHHVFADSDNNGPRGQALIDELIPAIEDEYRLIASPEARLLTGHSSGGWTSLWLQVTYPDYFGSVWSTAPDPVDFTDFQMINVYEDANMYTDEEGNARPLGRRDGEPILFYKEFADMEEVWGHGGQLQSFEAVFSEKGANGKPMKLWNRTDGSINPEVAEQWKRYDIALILTTHWEIIEKQLQGKIHVYMGEDDTFYLEGATRNLKEKMESLGSDARIELFPGKDHGSLMDSVMIRRIVSEMDDRLNTTL